MSVKAVTGDVLVNTTTADNQSWPRAERFADGSYIVVWQSIESDNSLGIYFQRYNAAGQMVHADGVTLGAEEVHANTTTAGDQFFPRITTLSNGSFVLTWAGPDDFSNDVYAQLYSAGGAKIGGEVHVLADENGRQGEPNVAEISGGYVIGWASSVGDGSGYGLYAQRFDLGG